MEGYDVAEVCENGHLITNRAGTSPQHRKDFCPDCGARTMVACPSCQEPIQGYYHVPGAVFLGFPESAPPKFCHGCGQPYPWTAIALEEARAVAAGATNLSEEERGELADAFEHTVRDTPRSQRAVSRVKELLQKAGPEACEAAKKLLTSLATDYAKKQLGL